MRRSVSVDDTLCAYLSSDEKPEDGDGEEEEEIRGPGVIFDLDGTLVAPFQYPYELDDIETLEPPLTCTGHMWYDGVVRGRKCIAVVRPGVLSALKTLAAAGFKLAIFSLGEYEYVHDVARALDPDGRLFGERVCSRRDLERRKLPPDWWRMRDCVAVDDSPHVWDPSVVVLRVPSYMGTIGFAELGLVVDIPYLESDKRFPPSLVMDTLVDHLLAGSNIHTHVPFSQRCLEDVAASPAVMPQRGGWDDRSADVLPLEMVLDAAIDSGCERREGNDAERMRINATLDRLWRFDN